MERSNLISTLKSLSPEESREFGYFVRSPFFNRSQGVVKLYEYLRKQYPEFEKEKIERKYVYKKIFETKDYNDGFMRVLISNLTKLSEEYLTQINFKKWHSTQKIFLLNELGTRRLEKEFKKIRKETEKLFNLTPPGDMNYYYDKGIFEDNVYFFNLYSMDKNKKIEDEEISLKRIIDNFTRFYLLASLTMYRKVLFKKNYTKMNVNLRFTEEILKILENHTGDFSDTPVIGLHLNEILLMTKGDKKYFDTLKNIYINKHETLTPIEAHSLQNILQRYLSMQVYKGNLEYEKEKLELYKAAVRKKKILFPLVKQADPRLFTSITETALSFGEIKWTEDFINEHKHLLPPEVSETVLNICSAKVEFEKGNFEEALSLLNNVKTKTLERVKEIKIILLKIYYEKAMYSEADKALDSSRHLLTRLKKTHTPMIYGSFMNFLQHYAILIKSKEKNKIKKVLEVEADLKKNKATIEYRWLKRKVQQLQGH
jgi:hypothetical protein